MLAPLIKVIMEMTSEETFKDVKLAREVPDYLHIIVDRLVQHIA
jgi:hypothetical protein